MIPSIKSIVQKNPIPCVRIFLMNDKNEMLLGKRKECGLFGLPGGKIEMFEEPEETAVRELKEETSLLLEKTEFKLIKVKNIMNKEWGLHYVNFYYFALFPKEQEIKNMEKDKTEDWVWMGEKEVTEKYEEIYWGWKQFAKEFGSIHNLFDVLKKFF